MGYHVTEFEDTPNPNAMKCWLDRPISEGTRSFLDADAAGADPVASALFERAGATCVLFGGDWLTVNKQPSAKWSTVKSRIREVLEAVGDAASPSGTASE